MPIEMLQERWVHIREFPSYMVSNLGEVKHARIGRLIRQREDRYGYLRVMLTGSSGQQFWYYVDEMVAKHFLPEYIEGCRIDHLDGNTRYNSVENLKCVLEEEWKTIPETPDYEVSSEMRFRKIRTRREVRIQRDGNVLLFERGAALNRSANKIFREAFGR